MAAGGEPSASSKTMLDEGDGYKERRTDNRWSAKEAEDGLQNGSLWSGAVPLGWAPPTPPSRASRWPSGAVLCLPRNVGDFVCFPFTQPSANLASEDSPIETVCRSLILCLVLSPMRVATGSPVQMDQKF